MPTVTTRPYPPEPLAAPAAGVRELGLVAAAILVLALLATWPLPAHMASALPGDLADPLLNTFTLGWGAERLRDGLRGFWDAPLFYPTRDALALSEHLLGVTFLVAPLIWLTGNAVLAYNVAFIGSYVLAGLGMYVLARSLWRSRWAAWIAALAFAFAPHRVMHVSHLQMLMSGWTPLALWGLHRYFATASGAALGVFAAAVALQALSNGYLMYFLLLPTGVVAVVELARRPLRGPTLRLLPRLAAATAAVGLVLLPVAMAYLRIRSRYGLRRSLSEMRNFSASASDFWHIPTLPLWHGRLPAGDLEHMLFPGLLTTMLAALAVAAATVQLFRKHGDARRWTVFTYAAVTALAAWLAFGPSTGSPYGWLAGNLPGFDGLRVPARFIVIFALGLAVLAGAGVELVLRRTRPGVAAAVTAVLGLLIIAEGYGGPMRLAPFDPSQSDRGNLNAWLRAAPRGGLLELPVAGPAFEPFTVTYLYNTLFHGHPIVNGYSGTGYALQDFLAGPGTPLGDEREIAEMLRGLRELGVRYLVLHRPLYEQRHGEGATIALERAMAQAEDQISSGAHFGESFAWQLAEPATGASVPVAAGGRGVASTEVTVTASAAAEDAYLAMDGTADTRWSSRRPQSGGEWVRLGLKREVDVAVIRFRTDRRGHSDRPRRLVVESEEASGSRRVLFDGSILPQMIGSIARHGILAPAAVDLPSNASRAIWLRQAGRTRWHWSIHELELVER